MPLTERQKNHFRRERFKKAVWEFYEALEERTEEDAEALLYDRETEVAVEDVVELLTLGIKDLAERRRRLLDGD